MSTVNYQFTKVVSSYKTVFVETLVPVRSILKVRIYLQHHVNSLQSHNKCSYLNCAMPLLNILVRMQLVRCRSHQYRARCWVNYQVACLGQDLVWDIQSLHLRFRHSFLPDVVPLARTCVRIRECYHPKDPLLRISCSSVWSACNWRGGWNEFNPPNVVERNGDEWKCRVALGHELWILNVRGESTDGRVGCWERTRRVWAKGRGSTHCCRMFLDLRRGRLSIAI